MSIYTKVLPYVYRLDNPATGEFYIGYREANKEPSHIDFPKYKTSAPKVKATFEEFQWHIVAEFFDGTDAYDFEQQLIFENWSNPMLINESCFHGKKRFKGHGRNVGFEYSEESKLKMAKSALGHKRNAGKTHSEETKVKMKESHSKKTHSEETKAKIRASLLAKKGTI